VTAVSPATAIHAWLLLVALPLQFGLVAVNARWRWLTPGELRFWTIAVFVFVEVAAMILPRG